MYAAVEQFLKSIDKDLPVDKVAKDISSVETLLNTKSGTLKKLGVPIKHVGFVCYF